jgi:hypothetical protein
MKTTLALIASTLAITAPAHAASITLGAARDNSIYDDGVGNLSNGLGTGLFAGRNGIGQTSRALLAFDLTSIPAGSTITSVSLRLVKGAGPTTANTLSLFKLTSDWGEGTTVGTGGGGGGGPATPGSATWVHTFFNTSTWTTPGGDFAASASASLSVTSNGAYTWSGPGLVADAQAWLNAGATNFGWILRGTETGSGTANRFASREGAAADRPQLTIEYTVPAPGTAALALVATAAMARRRRDIKG